MKKVINGKVYNSTQAVKLGKRGEDTLCRGRDGSYFVFRVTKDAEQIVPLDQDGQLVLAVRLDAERLERLKWAAAQQKLSVPEYISARL